MKLYKKQIKVLKISLSGGQGFHDEITELTDWLDEEQGEKEFNKYKEKCKDWYFIEINTKERFVQIVWKTYWQTLKSML